MDENDILTEKNIKDAEASDDPPSKTIKHGKRKKNKKRSKYSWLIWGISVFFMSFALTVVFSFITEVAVKDSAAAICVTVLLVLLVLNIGCDVLAMASKKIKGAKRAVTLCRNSEKLSSIFADVIGDICGIVSGAAGTALVVHIAVAGTTGELIASIGVSAAIGAFTVGGKAIFKNFAIKFNRQIVFGFAKFTTFFKRER